MALWGMWMPAGAAPMIGLSPFLLPWVGWRGVWLLAAAAYLVANAVVLRWVRPDVRRSQDPSLSQSRPRFGCFFGTQNPLRRPEDKFGFDLAHSGLRVIQLRCDQPKNRTGEVRRTCALVIDRFDKFIDVS
jgi:hypothetical protein